MGDMNVKNSQMESHIKMQQLGKGAPVSPAEQPLLEKLHPNEINVFPNTVDEFPSSGGKLHAPNVETSIGLHFHVDVIDEVEQIRNSKGGSQVQSLMEFKQVLNGASEKGLEKAQAYLVDQMAKPDNSDDQLLGALLKAVNQELNSRNNEIILKPFPNVDPFPPQPWHPKGGGSGRVTD